MAEKACIYCGNPDNTKEHVIPKCLYPASKAESPVQRLTLPCCLRCNKSWSDDEVHFRDTLVIAGEASPTVRELWTTKVLRSFAKLDGKRRVRELALQMKAVKTADGERYMVYPGKDEGVMRIARKIVRGLCHHHGIMSPVPDRQVWTDVLKYQVPPEFYDMMKYEHRDPDIFEYRYAVLNQVGISSVWLLTFFGRTTLMGLVSISLDGFSEEALSPTR